MGIRGYPRWRWPNLRKQAVAISIDIPICFLKRLCSAALLDTTLEDTAKVAQVRESILEIWGLEIQQNTHNKNTFKMKICHA